MNTKTPTENPTGMREDGSVIEPVKGVPKNPYDGKYPVKFSDETEEKFQSRVASFESAYFNSLDNPTLVQATAHLKSKHERELAALEASYENKAVPTAPEASETPKSSKKVTTANGKTKVVDADYVLEDGEYFA